jgi:hypothetical protein
MVDVMEVFDGAKNVDFEEYAYCEEIQFGVPVFKMKEPSVEEWNRRSRIQNTKMFIQINNRLPKDYQEVLTWIYGGYEKSHAAANNVTFA